MHVTHYEKLDVWQKAIRLSVETHGLAKSLPSDERFALALQMRRAAVSIAANIAEGQQREGTKDYIRFLGTSRGSLAELNTYFIVCREIGYFSESNLNPAFELVDDTSRMLTRLRQSLHRRLAARETRAKRKP